MTIQKRHDAAEQTARPPRAWRDDESGQAMTEYALVVAALMGGLSFMAFTFLPQFFRALQAYYDSYYVMLNLPFP